MKSAFGCNPYAGGFQIETPPLPECAITIRATGGGEGAVFLDAGSSLIYPRDCCGTLCARDGIKTGPRTPSGMDAYQKKLIVQKFRRM